MTLHPRFVPDVPEQTAQVAKAAFHKGNRYMQMRDELGTFFSDKQFVDLFPNVGQRAQPPWRLALVSLMQFMENLSDRQAADAVRGRIDWKYVLSLELEDDGFDFSVLSEFRARLIKNNAEARLFELMLQEFQSRGLLKARGKQRTDSTYILGQVRDLNRLEFIGETLRAALNEIAELAPEWLKTVVSDDWFTRYSRAFSDWRLPQKENERLELGEQVGTDGITLLSAIYATTAPGQLRHLTAVEFLRRTWVTQFYQEDDKTRWRRSGNLPPGTQLLHSLYDPDVRYGLRRGGASWTSYRVHFTESCDDDMPHLITHVETTLATQADVDTLETIHQKLDEATLLPDQHLVDSGYTSGDLVVRSQEVFGIDLVGPLRGDYSWQKKSKNGYDASQFQFDFERQVAICPQGKQSSTWYSQFDRYGKPVLHIQFRYADCRICPVRSLCTRAKEGGRQVNIRHDASHHAIQAARQRVETEEFKVLYRTRAGIEGTISQAVNALSMRRTRYRGLPKVDFQHLMTAAAINLGRVLDWLSEKPRSKTRISSFA